MSSSSAERTVPVINNMERDLDHQRRRRLERTGNNVNPRDRLFHALFIKIGNIYSRVVPKRFRVVLEVIVLLKGLLLFSFLSYLHFSFGRAPMQCLNTTNGNWPRDGILRVQIQPPFGLKKQLPRFFSARENMVLFHPCHNDKLYSVATCNSMAADMKMYYKHKNIKFGLREQCYRMNLSDFLFQRKDLNWKRYQDYEYVVSDHTGALFNGFIPGEIINEGSLLAFYEKYLAESIEPERHYIFEYSQEFGFLRLSQETRKRLKIPVKIITLDPAKEKCFGDTFSRFLLKYFLGYDDVLMNSIKKVADAENNTGYMLNVITGDHYKFVPWGIGRGSYIISLLLMFLFTISISTLLRYCHQQVFFFIIHVLQMLDMNIVLAFPIAPLFTVVLSLVGMETIMSEYFNDTTTSFYIILIVWAVDQFDTICCHTVISQKYWLRFFYLYHFLFYAYHYRFNGQYSSLALAATWFLIQHSMLYFFHNYELPAIENNPNNARRDEEAYLDEAVQMIVEGIEMVSAQHQPSPPQQPPVHTPSESTNEGTGEDISTRVREISTGANGGNRIFVFAADRPFIQMVRDFIQHIHNRMSAEHIDTSNNGESTNTVDNHQPGEGTDERSVNAPTEESSASAIDQVGAACHDDNIVPETVSDCSRNVLLSETLSQDSSERGTALNIISSSSCERSIFSHESSDSKNSSTQPVSSSNLQMRGKDLDTNVTDLENCSSDRNEVNISNDGEDNKDTTSFRTMIP